MSPRTALVTGASRGIGRGIALRLAQLGYALTVTSRSHDDVQGLRTELVSAGAPDVVAIAADMADREALPQLVIEHGSRFATMDVLILNAGVGSVGDVASYPVRRLDKTMDVNFTAALVLIQHALPLLRAAAAARPATGAKIIGMSSITGVYAEPGLAVYGASKAALLSLLETVNLEESERGVTATGIAPAFVATHMSEWAQDQVPADRMIPVDDVVSLVQTILNLSANTALGPIVMGRSGTTGYCA